MVMQDVSGTGTGQSGSAQSLDEARAELSRVIASSAGWNDGCDRAASAFIEAGLKQGLSHETLRHELCGYGLSRVGAKTIIQTATQFGGSEEACRANATLSSPMCILAFGWGFAWFPGIIPAMIVTSLLQTKGYQRRVNEFWRCWVQGVLFQIMLVAIICIAIYVRTLDIGWLMASVGFTVLWLILAKVAKRRLSKRQEKSSQPARA